MSNSKPLLEVIKDCCSPYWADFKKEVDEFKVARFSGKIINGCTWFVRIVNILLVALFYVSFDSNSRLWDLVVSTICGWAVLVIIPRTNYWGSVKLFCIIAVFYVLFIPKTIKSVLGIGSIPQATSK